MAMLDVKDLNVYYGKIHAIKNISLTVEEGELVSLIGANGAIHEGPPQSMRTSSSGSLYMCVVPIDANIRPPPRKNARQDIAICLKV